MLPQSEYESPMLANAPAPVAIAAITQDRALVGLLRSVVDPSNDLIFVNSEAELTPHLNSRRVSVALLDSMFIEGDLGAMAERLRQTWPDLVLVVVGTAEEQSKVAAQITTGVVYRFLHRPVSAPRVRLFVDAALRRHEVENVERTLEQSSPDFSRFDDSKPRSPGKNRGALVGIAAAVVVTAAGAWYAMSSGGKPQAETAVEATAPVVSTPADAPASEPAVAKVPAPRKPEAPPVASPEPPPATVTETSAAATSPAPAEESVRDRLRQAASAPAPAAVVQVPEEVAPRSPPDVPAPTFEQRLRDQLTQIGRASCRERVYGLV